jgi:hypothetical protein
VFFHNGSFTQNRGYAMYLYGTGHIITNNLIYGNANYGMQGSGYTFSAGGATAQRQAGFQALIANNTIAYNGLGGIVLTEAEHHDCIIENNIFYENSVNGAGTGHPNGVWVGYGGGGGGHIIRNNFAYSTAPRGLIFLLASDPTSYRQTNNICLSGCSAVATNPNMVNAPPTVPASPNFHLTSSSQATNFGLNLTGVVSSVSGLAVPTADQDGVVRPTTGAWEVGAYEFSSNVSAPSTPRNLQVN